MRGKGFFTKRTISNIIVVCIGVLLYMALANFNNIRNTLAWFARIFTPFVAGLTIAYLLNMPMRLVENKLLKNLRFKRALSILIVYLLAFFLLALLIGLIMPQLAASVINLVRNIPLYLNNLNEFVLWLETTFDLGSDITEMLRVSSTDLINEVLAWVREALPDVLNWTMQFGSGLINILTAFIASIYMLYSKEKLLVQGKRVLYAVLPVSRADNVMRVCGMSNRMFSGFIGGKIVDSVIIGLICFIFMTIANATFIAMPFALLISVIVGVTNIIPFFGPFIGAIPSIMILFLANPWSALWFTLFIIVLQQFDGNILGPKILGDSTGLPALWVLIAIIVGGGLFGFAGMVLGVPTVAVLYTIASDMIAGRLAKKNLGNLGREDEAETGAPPDAPEPEPGGDAPPE